MGGVKGDLSVGDLQRLEAEAKKRLKDAEAAGKRHLFISFVHEDERMVDYLRGQAKNESTQLDFADYSIKEPIDSNRAEYIKQEIREQIERVSVTLVYLSDNTADSAWVDWEIRESLKLGKGVVGVHQGETPPKHLPTAITENHIEIVQWKHKDLMAAIDRADRQR